MSISLDNTYMMSHGEDTSIREEDENSHPLDGTDEWIAVKPFVLDKCINLNNEIVNIVSISVEKEKVSLLTP